MDAVSYLRRQAAELRALAASQVDPALRDEFLALAKRCEDLANHMGGNGKDKAE